MENANVGYYPAIWQGMIALFRFLTGISEVDLMRYFVFFVFLLGELGYWFLSKELCKGDSTKGIFVYFTLLFSISPIIKNIRDGTYGEIIAMWFFLPLFLLLFLRRKILRSTVLLILIIAVHNLSAIMTGFLVLSFLAIYYLGKERSNVKFTLKVTALTLIFSSPLLFYNYFLTFFGVMNDSQRFQPSNFFGLGFSEMLQSLSGLTLFLGIFSLMILLIFYKEYRWLPLWLSAYLIAGVTFNQERFLREMCIPLSLSMGIVLYDMIKSATGGVKIKLTYGEREKEFSLTKNVKVTLLVFLFVSSMIAYNGIIHIALESDPKVRDYFTPLKREAYIWLNAHATDEGYTLVVRGLDSWTRVYLNNPVYEVFSPAEQKGLSGPDRKVNQQLTDSLLNPFRLNAFSTFKEYNVSYFILSTPLSNRWYPPGTADFAEILLETNYEAIPFYELIYYKEVNNEIIKIYKFSYSQLPEMLSSKSQIKNDGVVKNNVRV
ncbi:hypothetical protein HXY32_02795 [Candidatus Bathyarchaeota archaeon]|nr:hypothetical protein [Candidatus Bathyarchaeota archaeon]